jgi:hypothetical protein
VGGRREREIFFWHIFLTLVEANIQHVIIISVYEIIVVPDDAPLSLFPSLQPARTAKFSV